MRNQRLGFVSVVFEPEVPLQFLQARSFSRHLDPSAVGSIVVVDNTVVGMRRAAVARLTDAYGPLEGHVRVVRMKDLATMPGRHGWVRQQVAKLLASRLFDHEHYVALDAKNHLIRASGVDEFLTESGYARGGRHAYHDHPLRERLRGTLRYLGATDEQIAAALELFPTTTTPFVLSTPFVREILAAFGDDRTFAQEFERAGLLEFFLYSGWLDVRGAGYSSLYRDDPIQCPTVWPKASDRAGVRAAIDRADSIDAPFFAVHRRSLAQAGPAARSDLASFWARRGLFTSESAADDLIQNFQSGYRRRMMIARGAERGAAALSRVTGRRVRSADDEGNA